MQNDHLLLSQKALVETTRYSRIQNQCGRRAMPRHVTFMTIDDAEHYTQQERAAIVAAYAFLVAVASSGAGSRKRTLPMSIPAATPCIYLKAGEVERP
jgi:hypothetical protein